MIKIYERFTGIDDVISEFEDETQKEYKKIPYDLRMCLDRFDHNGKYAKQGKFTIYLGGYDLWYGITYDGITIIECVNGKVTETQEEYKSLAKLVADYYNQTYVEPYWLNG